MPTSAHDGAETHVGKLIKRHAAGRSLRELDRQHGLGRDYLARYARGDWDPNRLRDVIDNLTKALGASREDVSEAFALDMEFTINGRQLKVEQVNLLESYDALSAEGRIALLAVTRALCEQFPASSSAEKAC